MEAVELGPKRGLLIVNLIGALCFVVSGVFILGVDRSTKAILAGVGGIVFFGACAVVFARRLMDAAPVVVIDDRGIRDRRMGVVIAWDRILGASVPTTVGPGAAVVLKLRNPEEIIPKLNPLYRRLAAANKALGFDQIAINVTGFGADVQAIADLIAREAAQRRLDAESAYRAPPVT